MPVNSVALRVNSSRWLGLALLPTLALTVCSRPPAATESTRAASSPKASPIVETKTYHGVGVVISLNVAKLVIEINHEDIPDLMPAMQMLFYVKDKSLLAGLKRNDRIEFTLENGVGGLKITAIKKRQ